MSPLSGMTTSGPTVSDDKTPVLLGANRKALSDQRKDLEAHGLLYRSFSFMNRTLPLHLGAKPTRRPSLSWRVAVALAVAGLTLGAAVGAQLPQPGRGPDQGQWQPEPVEFGHQLSAESTGTSGTEEDREPSRLRFARYGSLPQAQETQQALPSRFLKALSALRSSQYRLAAAEFAALAEEYPALADRARYFGARAHLGLDRPLSAAALLEEVHPEASLHLDARLLLAQLHHKEKRLGEAGEILQTILSEKALTERPTLRDQVLWELAQVERDAGHRSAEREALLTLWSEHPTSSLARRASAKLTRPIPVPAAIRRAESLVEMDKVEEGLAALPSRSRVGSLPGINACHAQTVAGKAYRRQRQYAKSISTLKAVVRVCTDTALLPEALFALADAQSIGEPKGAVVTADLLAKRFPDHPYADDALFLGAQMVKHTDPVGATERLAAISERYSDSNAAPEAAFQLFLTYRHQQQPERALEALEGVLNRVSAGELRQRARYWRARTLESTRRLEAELELERLGEEHAGTFHGLLARSRLTELNPERGHELTVRLAARAASASSEGEAKQEDGLEFNAHVTAGAELLRLGLPGASAELAAGAKRLPELEQSQLIQLMAEAKLSGELRQVISGLSRASGLGVLNRNTLPLWKSAYSSSYRELIEQSGEKVGVDALLLRALVRQESQFHPEARSPVGAMGLAQVMLPTAREVASRYGLGEVTEEVLFSPQKNLHIGALYLRGLLRQFDSEPILAVAAYNAGPGAVRRWIKGGRFAGEWDAWAEDIPIAETREYVKHVLGGYAAYRLLDKPKDPPTWASRP